MSGMRTLRAFAFGALLPLLAACISAEGIAPAGRTLDAERITDDAAFTAWPQTRWWERYGDAELSRLIESALATSPDLERARADVAQAEAAIGFTHSRLLPQVQLGAEVSGQRYPEHSLYPPRLGGDHLLDSTVEFRGRYELDFFGRNAATVAAATSHAQAAAAAAQAARVAVASAVARAWFDLAESLAEREVVLATRKQRETILTLVQARVAEGLDSKVELRQAEGALPAIDGELAALDERAALLRSLLSRLTQTPLAETAGLCPRLAAVAAPSLPANIPAELLGHRADVTAARWEIEARLHGSESVRAEFYPSVNLTAFAGFTALGLGALFEASSASYGVAPALSLPVFDGDRLRSKLKFADAEIDRAIASYNGALLDAMQDVVRAVTSLRALTARQAAQAEAQAAAESAYSIALQRYRAGLTGYLTVLTTESEVLRERRAATALKARGLGLDVELNRALGGGFDATVIAAAGGPPAGS